MISGEQVVDRLRPRFRIWIKLRTIFKELDCLWYERNSKDEPTLENIKAHRIPMGKDWKLVTKYHKIVFPPKSQAARQTSWSWHNNPVDNGASDTPKVCRSTRSIVSYATWSVGKNRVNTKDEPIWNSSKVSQLHHPRFTWGARLHLTEERRKVHLKRRVKIQM